MLEKKPMTDEEKAQYEIVKKEINEIVTDDVLDMFVQLEYYEQQIDLWKFKVKDQIKELFKANNIKSFKNDYIEITYVAPSTRKSVDTQKLKDLGLYDDFCKESPVAESLRVKLKEDR